MQVEPNYVVPNELYYKEVAPWTKLAFDYVPFAQRFYRWWVYIGQFRIP